MKKTLLILAAMLCCITLNAQQPAGDGSQANPYQIATADDLVWFANHVNSGNTTACAILTTDITMNNNVLDTDGRPNDGPFTAWTPIGKPGKDFEGEFNGDGHTISGLYFYNTDENDVGVFGKAINNAYIHDLGVRDSYFYGGSWVGGICGDFASGRIENCWSSATVRAYGNDAGGICGSCWKYASVANCYNIGDVSLYQEKTLDGVIKIKFGGICGTVTYNENAISIDNCYTLKYRKIPHGEDDPYAGLPNVNLDCDKIYGVLDGDAEVHDSYVKDAAAFVGGEVCCRLNRGVTDGNQKWYQTLGSDLSPVMDNNHNTVYYVYDGDVLTYSNTQPDAPTHIVSYVDADGQEQTAVAVEITDGTSTLSAPWYVVSGSDVQTGSLTCNGAVHLILADGGKLTATGLDYAASITVSGEGNSLVIYGQTAQSGQLFANGGRNGAGIGGGDRGSSSNITINGGIVTATGGYDAAGIGGGRQGSGSNITINGGTVTANGSKNGTAIGGGFEGSGSDITINGGTVIANGGENGAGIGGGYHGLGSNIIINDGTITANGGEDGAGIGGGQAGSGSNITISGGTVTANGGDDGAGIGGGGNKGSGSDITINGGTVTANGGSGASGIGGGSYGSGSDIFVVPELIVRAGNDNPPTTGIAHTATTDIADDLNGKRYATVRIPQGGIVTYGECITVSPQFASGDRVASDTEVIFTAEDRYADNYEFLGFYKESTFENKITNGVSGLTYTVTVLDDDISVYAKYEEFIPTPYIDANGQEQSVKTTEITNGTSTLIAGWYVVFGSDVQTGTLTCNGAVNLILADGAKLTATGGSNQAGITVSGGGNSLTIYSQTAQTGQLIAKGGSQGAGIGGGNKGAGSNIAINGGTVTANGGEHGAGIGGGFEGIGTNITINGGTVTASGGNLAAGIGGGREGSGSNIAINGGEVTANGGEDGAGIGGGYHSSGYNITINGGTVTASGGGNGAGIGGGYNGSGWSVKVATALTVYADNTNPPTIEILHTDDDIAPYIVALRYVIVNNNKTNAKEAAIAAINAAIEGVTNEDIIAIATNAINAINAATNVHEITVIKEQALAAIASAKAAYAAGQAESLGEMGEPCTDCPAVEVTKGTKTVKLYNPESVRFKKTE